MVGLLSPRIDAPVNMIQPVNLLHPLKPVAWWLALPGTTGGSQMMDITSPGPNGLHLTMRPDMNPSAAWDGGPPGRWGSLKFDGVDDRAEAPDSPLISPTAEMSFVVWAKQDALEAQNAIAVRGNYFATRSWTWALQTGGTNTQLNVFITASPTDGGDNWVATPTDSWTAGEWHQIAFSYKGSGATDADRLKVYIDRKEQALVLTGTIPSSLVDTPNPFRVGDFEGLSNREWNGNIDDMLYYPRAISSEEVEQLYWLAVQGHPGLLNRIQQARVVVAAAALTVGEIMAATTPHYGLGAFSPPLMIPR